MTDNTMSEEQVTDQGPTEWDEGHVFTAGNCIRRTRSVIVAGASCLACSGRSRRETRPWEQSGVLWVHGMPARSFEQVAGYLTGNAHDQSKVQVYVGGQFYDVVLSTADARPQP